MPHTHIRLPRSFFTRDTHIVARALLGMLLVRVWRGHYFIGRIVEVESYVGMNDAACHAARGKTKRNAVMFGPAGHAYVYLVYGIHHCFNIVTERNDFPAAVLIRALTPVQGTSGSLAGPGRLTQAFHIHRAHNGEDVVTSDRLFVARDHFRLPQHLITISPRIGVDYAGKDASLPWRYFVPSSIQDGPGDFSVSLSREG